MNVTPKIVRLCALLGGASAAALLASPVYAQDNTVEEIVVTATGREAAIQDVPIPITAVTGETIENAGITDVRGLQQLAPSFRFFTGQSAAAGTTAFIRGIGTGGDNPGFESAVGFFIDGVYRNRSGTALADLPEVERIEVLRGPQGTLFGRNTSAGAISVTTKGPSQELGGYGEVTFGDYDRRRGVFGVTGPVSDALALRLDGGFEVRDGFITDVSSDRDVNDRDRWFLRTQARFDINDDASLRLIADVSRTDEQCCGAVTLFTTDDSYAPAVTGVAQAFGGIGLLDPDPEARRTTISPNRDLNEKVEDQGVSGELNWNFGGIRMTSITSYRDWYAIRNQDIDYSDLDRAYREGQEVGFETLTQEIRFQGEAGILDWLVGGFYADESLMVTDRIRVGNEGTEYVDALIGGLDINGPAAGGTGFAVFRSLGAGSGDFFTAALTPGLTAQLTPFLGAGAGAAAAALAGAYAASVRAAPPAPGTGQIADAFQQDTKSLALFTHNEISLGEQLTLTLGLRWNHEEKEFNANLDSDNPTCAALQNTAAIPGSGGLVTYQALTTSLYANPSTRGLMVLLCNPVVNTAGNGTYEDEREENEWSGTASLSYKPIEDLMIYGGYSRGYKAGGYNLDRSGFNSLNPTSTEQPPADDPAFEPEFIDAYELGWKWTLLNGGLLLNGNLFYEQVSDYQLNAFSGFNFLTQNVQEVVSKGFELDLMARPTDALTVQLGALYLDAYYNSDEYFGDPSIPEESRDPNYIIASGTALSGAADWTFTGAVTYQQPISDDLELIAFVDGRYQSEYRTQTLSRNEVTDQEAFAIFNARLGVGRQDETWRVEAYVRNVFDTYYHAAGFAVPEQTGVFAAFPGEPRTYGVSLRSEF